MKYMPSGLNRVFVAWTTKLFWKEPEVVFPNWHMICDGSSSSSAQRVGVSESLKPGSPFDVRQFDCIEVVVY